MTKTEPQETLQALDRRLDELHKRIAAAKAERASLESAPAWSLGWRVRRLRRQTNALDREKRRIADRVSAIMRP